MDVEINGGVRSYTSRLAGAVRAPCNRVRTRECHGYTKTCGFEVTGFAGTGTVVDFGTPRHTAYLYRSIAGIPGVYYNKVSIIFIVLKLVFSHIKFIVSHCDATKYGYAIHASIFTSYCSHSHSHPTSKHGKL
jgi:hypothetical protein